MLQLVAVLPIVCVYVCTFGYVVVYVHSMVQLVCVIFPLQLCNSVIYVRYDNRVYNAETNKVMTVQVWNGRLTSLGGAVEGEELPPFQKLVCWFHKPTKSMW